MSYLKGAELVIHNAPFDVGFLDHEFKLTKRKFSSIATCCSIVDTLALARRKHPGQQNNLDALCRRYHVDNSNRHYHGALLDAELLAQVYLLMTGGQTQLFDQGNSETTKVVTIDRIEANDRAPLPIIRASENEIAGHQAYLKLIKEASGLCLWAED